MRYLEAEAKALSMLKNINPVLKQAFWLSFALINLTFLFHTVNFMFGDHDWNYVRGANYWSEGAFEGRPLHFVLQSLFFDGQVLPVLNNLLAFAAMALSGILLAVYWRVPCTLLNYTLFAVFVSILPYTMVWLFYAKDMLINLSLPLICVGGLLLGEFAVKKQKPLYHLGAMLLFFFAFASYAAVINLLAVCLLGKIMLDYVRGDSVSDIAKQKILPILDIAVALLLFKLMLMFSSSITAEYNTKTITLAYMPQKFMETVEVMLTQFVTPIPFMEYKFKLLLLALCLLALVLLMWQGGARRAAIVLCLVAAMLFASKLAFFLADERGQILAEMENFAFVPRLDFYGLGYVYAFAAACVLIFAQNKIRKAGVALLVVAAFLSCVRDVYAQKVWKLGFDAEMKAHERIVSRLEQMIYADKQYRLLQIGSLSLRKNYYRSSPEEAVSLDLLSTSFTPEFMSRIVYNFYYPRDIFYANATVTELSQHGKDFIRNQAKPFPAPNSIYIDGDIVIVVLTAQALEKAKSQLYY